MKKILLQLSFILFLSGTLFAAVKVDSEYTASGKVRKLYYSIPNNYDPARAYPLVVGLHYCGGTALSYRNSLSPLSDSINAIIVCPDNFQNQVTDTQLDIITAAADSARKAYNIAADSMYLTGMSCNGETTLRQGLKKFYPFKGIFPWVPYISSRNFAPYDLESDVPTVMAVGTVDDNFLTLMILMDSLRYNSPDKNLVLAPNIGHVEIFSEFPSVMIKCIRYINSPKTIEIAAIRDIKMKNTESAKELEAEVTYSGDKELQAEVISSNNSRLKIADVVYSKSENKLRFKLAPVAGKTGTMKVIAEVKEKNGKAISQSIFNVVLEKDDNTNIGTEKIGSTLITPNPASGYINISGTERIKRYEIMNISGQLIMKENPELNEFSLDVSNLPRGIYYFRSYLENKTENLRFITK